MIQIIARPLLGLPSYHVVTGETPEDEPLLLSAAIRLGDELARARYGPNGGYVVLFNAGAGRRKPWPHAHVVAVRSVGHKRLVLGLLLLKRWLPSRAPTRKCQPSPGLAGGHAQTTPSRSSSRGARRSRSRRSTA